MKRTEVKPDDLLCGAAASLREAADAYHRGDTAELTRAVALGQKLARAALVLAGLKVPRTVEDV